MDSPEVVIYWRRNLTLTINYPMFTPSKFQAAIFVQLISNICSLIIEAVAGSGKTTTIVEALKKLPTNLKIVFIAFNKNIVDELKTRVPKSVFCFTFHSFWFGALKKSNPKPFDVQAGKMRAILKDLLPDERADGEKGPSPFAMYFSFCAKLVGLAKNSGMGYLMPDTEDNWFKLVDHYDISLAHEDANEADAVAYARKALVKSNELAKTKGLIDYDDMLFLPLIWNIKCFQNDVVFVDECQDLNDIQHALLKRMVKPGGRLVAVGDSNQAIYGFRGAASDSMEKLTNAFNCKPLPLSVSYRCAQAVVREAQKYVSHIQPHDKAPEGKVEQLDSYNRNTFTNEDAIICRNSMPLVSLAYTLMKEGVACKILGREIGQGLVTLVKQLEASTIDSLEAKLAEFESREVAKCLAKDDEEKAEAVKDRCECIRLFIGKLETTNYTISGLVSKIESLFSDNTKGILTLCTAHKSKGLEWNRVFILDFDKYMPSKWAKQEWQKQQETNLIYVAITRAKSELYYMRTEDWTDQHGNQPKAKEGEEKPAAPESPAKALPAVKAPKATPKPAKRAVEPPKAKKVPKKEAKPLPAVKPKAKVEKKAAPKAKPERDPWEGLCF